MDKVIGYIYETMDYDKFRRLPDNRDVLSDRVNKLIASMTERYILNPITVNEKMEVIDGQGRFDARKEMKQPIHYYIVEGADSDDCRRMNRYNSKWTQLDFAKSYAKKGIPDYIRILELCKVIKLPLTVVLRLSSHSSKPTKNRATTETQFLRGKLSFTKSDADTVRRVASLTDDIIDALQFSGRPNDSFRTAVKVMVETNGYDHERMLRNCRACRASYAQMAKVGDQLVEFERIYNYRSKKGGRLYFSDYMRNRGENVRDYSKTYSPYNDTDVSTLKEENNANL